MSTDEFKNLKLTARWDYLKDNQYYIASRAYGSFRVDLHYNGEWYAEVWKRIGLNQVHWIELTTQEHALKNYVDIQF